MTKLATLTAPTEICARDTGAGCFASGTLVRTPRGMFAIEGLAVGDHVLTHGKRLATITKVSHATSNELVRVVFSDQTSLTCTPWHRFYDLRGDLYRAEQLGVRSAVRCHDHSIVHVLRIERLALPESGRGERHPVFNLSLEREVAFFANGKLVEAPHEARVLGGHSLLAASGM
ncbi:MAG: Hint domain-containing protein [Kofleriaceae bacterium]